MGPRANLSVTLIVAGVTLLVAIAIGNEMGNRVLGQATERGPAIAATPVATPVPNGTNAPGMIMWKRQQVVTVATDPAFPDPRVTPTVPPPPPTAAPVLRRLPTPSPRPTQAPAPEPTVSRPPYTSPPLPLPLVTHASESATAQPSTAATEPAPNNPAPSQSP